MANENEVKAPAEAPVVTEKKSNPFKKIIILAVVLVLFLIITNPSILFFLPETWRAGLSNAWGSLFGDVDQVTSVVRINWISIFKIVVIVLVMLILQEVLKIVLNKLNPKTGKGKSILSMSKSFSGYAIALIAIVWCLSAIGVNLSTIFASLGIIALIIGFAAESLIEDIVVGVFMVFEDDFNVGDIIEFNGFRGTVDSIGIRVTSIKDPGGNIKIVNNSDIRNVLNRSRTASKAVVDIPISYAQDLEAAEKVLGEIAEKIPTIHPETFSVPLKYLGVQALDASSVNLRFVAEVDESNIYSAARLMNREFKIGMDKAGLEIPFQQVVVHKGE